MERVQLSALQFSRFPPLRKDQYTPIQAAVRYHFCTPGFNGPYPVHQVIWYSLSIGAVFSPSTLWTRPWIVDVGILIILSDETTSKKQASKHTQLMNKGKKQLYLPMAWKASGSWCFATHLNNATVHLASW